MYLERKKGEKIRRRSLGKLQKRFALADDDSANDAESLTELVNHFIIVPTQATQLKEGIISEGHDGFIDWMGDKKSEKILVGNDVGDQVHGTA